jgi:hypothetical protein
MQMAGYELVTTVPGGANGGRPRSGRPSGGPNSRRAAATARPDYADGETDGAFADRFMSLELETA